MVIRSNVCAVKVKNPTRKKALYAKKNHFAFTFFF